MRFVKVFRDFAEAGFDLADFAAYGNKVTRSYASAAEKERRESMLEEQEWDNREHHTGSDEKRQLRCGV